MTDEQLPFDGGETTEPPYRTNLSPFAAHVFFKVDGALDFDRDRFADPNEAIEWACSHLGLMTSPVAVIVYEQSTVEDKHGTHPLIKLFELRVGAE